MNKKFVQKTFVFLLLLFVFLLPWQTRFIYQDIRLAGQLWQYGRLSIYASALVLLLAALFFGWQHKEQWHLSKQKWWYGLVLYGLLWSATSAWPVLSFYYLAIIFVTIIFIFLAQKVSKRAIMWTLLFSGLVQSMVAIYQSLTQSISAHKWLGLSEQLVASRGVSVLESGGRRILRAYGSLPHPNILAGFLVIAILVGLYLWHSIYVQSEAAKWQVKKIKKYIVSLSLIILSLVLMSFALLATFSRSALLALGLAGLFIFIFSLSQKNYLSIVVLGKYLILLLMVGVVFNLYYPQLWSSRLDFSNRLEAKSIQDRKISYGQLDWTSPQEIIFGQGLGHNTYWAIKKNNPQTVDQVQPIHNWFLLAWAEAGFLGIFIFLILLFSYFKKGLGLASDNNAWPWAFVLAIFSLGLFDHYFWTTWTGWLMLGAVVVLVHKTE